MNFRQESSQTWNYDAQLDEQTSLFYPLDYGIGLDSNYYYTNTTSLDVLDTNPGYHHGWNLSPFGSPRSSSSPTSSGEGFKRPLRRVFAHWLIIFQGPEELAIGDFAISRQFYTPCQ